MPVLPEPLSQLIARLAKLPGIGPRSAERIALNLVQADAEVSHELSRALLEARARIIFCAACGGLTEKSPCALCSDPRRDPTQLCLVEKPVDILTLEKAGSFRGHYHVLGGKISPLNGVEPEDLRIAELEQRLEKQSVREVILALPTDVEGDATSFYLARRLKARPRAPIISRIAHGIPAGSGLDFADELTLSRAMDGRRPFSD